MEVLSIDKVQDYIAKVSYQSQNSV